MLTSREPCSSIDKTAIGMLYRQDTEIAIKLGKVFFVFYISKEKRCLLYVVLFVWKLEMAEGRELYQT